MFFDIIQALENRENSLIETQQTLEHKMMQLEESIENACSHCADFSDENRVECERCVADNEVLDTEEKLWEIEDRLYNTRQVLQMFRKVANRNMTESDIDEIVESFTTDLCI